MTPEPRPIRDIVAEAMRRERLGLMRPLWLDWCAIDKKGGPELIRLRADHLIRILGTRGVSVVRTEDPAQVGDPSEIVWRWPLVGTAAERAIRATDETGSWEIVRIEGDQATVQLRFKLSDAYILAARVLSGDREVLKEQGVMSALAAALEIHRTEAAGQRIWP